MDLLFPAFGPYEMSSELAVEIIVQKIKVSETPISLSLGPLNRNVFIRPRRCALTTLWARRFLLVAGRNGVKHTRAAKMAGYLCF